MPRSLATVPWADVLSVGRGVLAVCLIPLAVAAAPGALQAGVLTMALLTDVADGPVARAQGGGVSRELGGQLLKTSVSHAFIR